MDYFKKSLQVHKKLRGVLEVRSKVKIKTKDDLSVAYSPGVAEVSRAIARDTRLIREYTIKGNSVAVVTDGSAVLGLGNVGPEAALPVMEGKAILFKDRAGIDAYPICLATQDVEEIIKTVKYISVGFGGINLEDISAPRCFEIEKRLKDELNIPVMHDDQHGTAIVVLAALINALTIVRKEIQSVSVVINGAGAAAMAIFHLLVRYGVASKHIIMVDSKGIVGKHRTDLNTYKGEVARSSNGLARVGMLAHALVGADICIGVSVADSLKREWVETMADSPIIFALANPNPEISLAEIKKTKAKIFGTGRSDYPNQINNVLVFPGLFRGVLDSGAVKITEEMKIATAEAIAGLVSKKELSPDYILPRPLDPRVVKTIARAVKKCSKM